jgi:hypothetical protein
MHKLQRRLVLLFLALVLILLYYGNNTYILNFFDEGFPFLIRKYYNDMIDQMNNPQYDFDALYTNPRIISLIFFLVIINGLHTVFITAWFNSKKAGRIFLVHVFFACLLIIINYGLHSLFPDFQKFYTIARIIKDYILSPIAVVLFILLWRIYGVNKPTEG